MVFNLDIGNGFLKGFIDFWYVNKRGEVILIDWKTTSQVYTKHQIKTSSQLTAYAYAYRRLFGNLPYRVCYVTMNKKTKKIASYFDFRSDSEVEKMEIKFQNNIAMMEAEIHHTNEHGCYTGPEHKWKCEFYKECWGDSEPIIVKGG